MLKNDCPLVSIMIPNYNYAHYLDECLQSALNQTYDNIEIIVLDNASTDNSVEVLRKYIDKGVRVCRNAYNVYNATYHILYSLTQGDYLIMLGSDDYIEPTFIERAVAIFKNYPNVGYVHGERDWITPTGKIIDLDPFYKCSFVAQGHNIMPVYMITTVAHASQGVFRRAVFEKIGRYFMRVEHLQVDRALWFYLSFVSDGAYIRDKMVKMRIGGETETRIRIRDFLHPILIHMTITDFIEFARKHGISAVYERENEAFLRLSKDMLEWAADMVNEGDFDTAIRYLTFAKVTNRGILDTPDYDLIETMAKTKTIDVNYINNRTTMFDSKIRGYEPPIGYEILEGCDLCR